MADIINTPNRGGSGGWIAALIAIVAIILLVLLFFPDLFAGRMDNTLDTRNDNTEEGAIIPPPTVNNTVINSTSTINLGTSTATSSDE